MSLQDSWLHCPRTRKLLVMEVGQDDTGDGSAGLTVEHYCLCCERPYTERGPATPRAARITSTAVRTAVDRVRAMRLGGVEVPLVYDKSPWPEEEWELAMASQGDSTDG